MAEYKNYYTAYNLSALEAIERSEKFDEIVNLRYTEVNHNNLFAECDDWVDTGEVVEYWGENWRVHLIREVNEPL